MNNTLDAVFFDLDGTLVNTIPLIFRCYEFTLTRHLPQLDVPRSVIISNLGRSLDDILRDYALAAHVADPDTVGREMLATYRNFEREHLPTLIQPYEGVREALEGLRALGVRMGVVTSKVEWAARLSYDRYGLGEFLSVAVFHDDTARHKPDPEPVLLAASRAGIPASRCAYVGDSVHDMAAGRAAGMRTIGALWGPFAPEDLRRAGADELAQTPADLVALVATMRGSAQQA